MKLSTALLTGMFVSISALFFFRQEEKLMYFITGQRLPEQTADNDKGKGKKAEKRGKTVHLPRQTKTVTAPAVHEPSWQELLALPPITAVKTVDKTSNVVAGDFLNYTVVISNNTGNTVNNLSFTDNVDPNTTVVAGSLQTSPVAFDDSYTAIGNVGLSVPAANGILSNDNTGTNPAAVFTAVSNAATTQGGSITIAADGGFSYTPAAGFTGNDTYTYTLTNAAGSSTATVTIAVSGMIWFINGNSVAAEDGRLNTPYRTVATFQANNTGAAGKPGDNHFVFVYESSSNYSGNITLRNGQKLIGQDATTDLPTITGYTAATYPYSTSLLPALNNANPTIVNLTASGTDNVVTLNSAAGTNTIRGLTIGNKVSGSGIFGNGFGTLTVSETIITGTGQALNLTTGSVSATFASVSSSSGANAVFFSGINGTAALGGGALSGSTGDVFSVNGGTAGITYSGTIAKTTSAGNVVDIQSKTGGTVALSGAITATSPGEGINLQSNTGATVNFTGGLSLSTAAGVAFNATGGGTVSATQDNTTIVNTLTTTTAAALNVVNTTIGTGGLTFRSINVGTAGSGPTASGITLNNTGTGGLTVTGQGTTAGSGGTIQRVANRGIELITAQNINLNNMELLNANTGDAGFVGVCEELVNGGCYAALYGSAVTGLSLTKVNITNTAEQGINLNNVTTLSISNCTVQGNGDANEEGALKAQDLKGTCTISNSIFKNSANRIAHIRNSSGSVNFTVNNSQFINEASNTSAVKQDCFQMRLKNSVSATVSITNSTFKRAGTAAIQIMAEDNSTANVTITGCTADREGTLMKGIEVGADHTARMNASVDGNPLITANGEVSLNLVSTGTTSVMNATGRNNTVKGGNDEQSTFVQVNLWATQTATNNVLVSGNIVSEIDGRAGIESFALHSQPGSGTSTINATIQSNTVTGDAAFTTGNGVRVTTSATGGAPAASANCSQVASNNVTVASGRPQLRVTAVNQSTIRLSGTGSDVTSIWNGNSNTPASPPAIVQAAAVAPATISYGGAACPTPSGTPIARIATAQTPETTEVKEQALATETVEPTTEPLTAATAAPEPSVEAAPLSEPAQSATQTATATNVTVSGIALPAGKSITIKFQVQVNNPLPASVCNISNQGTVSGPSITTIQTDNDNDATNGINPTVSLVKDETPPTVNNCPGTVTVQTGPGNTTCTATATWTEPTATDNCSGPLTYFSRTHAPGSSFNLGTTTITYVFKDASGNQATCSFDVVVQDNTPPVISGCPSTITVQTGAGNTTCTKTATWTEPTATDNCTGGSLAFFSRSHAPGSTFNKGTTTVTYVFKDGTGNQSTCSFDVVVQDNTPPVVSGCPTDITVYTGTGNTTCTQTATWTEPTATDACDGSLAFLSRSHAPGTSFNKGTTPVTYVFKDAAGNQVTCSFNVTVVDNTPPVLTCPANISVIESPAGSGSATVTYPPATATDNCTTLQAIQYSQASGTSFSVGTTTVNVSVKDAANNESTCSFTVTVSPSCQITAPANVTVNNDAGQCGAIVNYPAATTTGNCGTLNYSKASGSFFNVGTTTVNITSPSTGQSASFTVTVKDNTVPTISGCPANITVQTGTGSTTCNKAVSWTPPTASDNCGIQSFTSTKAPGDVFPVGTTTVTYTAVDVNGKQSTCSFTVTVQDNTQPVVSGCPGNQTLTANSGGCTATATWTEPTATDNCGGTLAYFSRSHAPGSAFPAGTNTVTYVFKDGAGNQSTCSFTITVSGTITASIPSTKAYSSPGVSPDVIYRGWTPASQITYTAQVSGGTSPYSYKWTTSAGLNIQGSSTQASVKVTGTTPGSYTLTLKVTDAYGCSNTTTKTVTIVDVRCGNKLDKVLMCKPQPAGTICVETGSVTDQLNNGASLGACPANSVITRTNVEAKEIPLVTEKFGATALPNPSHRYFTIGLTGAGNEKVLVEVYDLTGRLMERRSLQGVTTFKLGDNYGQGAYLLRLTHGNERRELKLLKLSN